MLVGSPHAPNSWGSARPKPGTPSQVSHVGGRNASAITISCCIPRKLGQDVEPGLKRRYSATGHGLPRWGLSPAAPNIRRLIVSRADCQIQGQTVGAAAEHAAWGCPLTQANNDYVYTGWPISTRRGARCLTTVSIPSSPPRSREENGRAVSPGTDSRGRWSCPDARASPLLPSLPTLSQRLSKAMAISPPAACQALPKHRQVTEDKKHLVGYFLSSFPNNSFI